MLLKVSCKMWNLIKKNKMILLPALITFGIVLIIYICIGVYPFGGTHLLKIDLFHSGAPFLNERYNKLTTGESFMYSWRGGLGSDFGTVNISTIFNPATLFCILFMFIFKTSGITEVFSLIFIMQFSLCAFTFAYFLREKFKCSDLLTTVFSVMYAFCSFLTAYFWVYSWASGLIYLPLLAISIERLVKYNKLGMYTVVLSLSILSFYMMGFFLCGFSVGYYLLTVIMNNDSKVGKTFKRTLLAYIKGSLLAGGIAAIVLIPTMIGLRYMVYSLSPKSISISFSWKWYFSFFKFLTGNYFGMKPAMMEGGQAIPNIYSGILAFILLPFYYINKNIGIKEKLYYTLLLFALYLCFNVGILDYITHGMHFTNGLPHRYSFMYSFFILVLSYKAIRDIEIYKLKSVVIVFSILLILTSFLYLMYPMRERFLTGLFTKESFYINIVLILAYFILLYILCATKGKQVIFQYILVLMVITEVGVSAWKNFNLYIYTGDEKRNLYALELLDDMNVINGELNNESEFYRSEINPTRTLSDGRLFNYNGIATFGNTYSGTTRLLKSLGANTDVNKIVNNFYNPLLNSIFALKYSFNRGYLIDSPPSFFVEKKEIGSMKVYENPYVLPIGFMVDEKLTEWEGYQDTSNPFVIQNEFVNNVTGLDKDLFSAALSCEDIVYSRMTLSPDDENTYNFIADADVTPDEELVISASFTARESKHTYIYLSVYSGKTAKVQVDGESVMYRSLHTPSIDTLDIGFVNAGSNIKIDIIIKNNAEEESKEEETQVNKGFRGVYNYIFNIFNNDQSNNIKPPQTGTLRLYVCQMDFNYFEQIIGKLKEQTLNVSYYDAKTIKGKISVAEDGVMFLSIPYDDRWHIFINGKKADSQNLMGALLGVKLNKGNYDIELIFKPAGYVLGGMISSISLMFLAFEMYKEKRRTVM